MKQLSIRCFIFQLTKNGNMAQRVGLHVLAKNRLNILVNYLRSVTSEFEGRITANDFVKATNKIDYNQFRIGKGGSSDFMWSTSEKIVAHLETNIIPIVKLDIIAMVAFTHPTINKSLVVETLNNIKHDYSNGNIIIKQDYSSGNIFQNVSKNDTNVISAKENIAVNMNNTCNVLLPHAKQRHGITIKKQREYIPQQRHDVAFMKQQHYVSTLLYHYNKIVSTMNNTS